MARIGIAAVVVIVAGTLTAGALQLLDAPPPISSPSPAIAPGSAVEGAGILMVEVGEQVQAVPPSEEVAVALSELIDLAMANPDDVGYSWFDPETHELVLSAATSTGRSVLEAAAADFGVAYRVRDVTHSYAELQRIQFDATRLVDEGVPDADLIYSIVPDHRDNRTMIVISAMSLPLLEALAQRFPPDAVAVQVDATRGPLEY